MGHHSELWGFIQTHKPQLESSNVPSHFWESLYNKIINQVFDAGNTFTLLQIDYEDEERTQYDPVWSLQVINQNGIKAADPKHIYLVDHAWTFKIESASNQFKEIESLRIRLANILGLDPNLEVNELSNKIFNQMWKYCNGYWFGAAENAEDRVPVWYILDELGSAIQHSDDPNFAVVPFIYIPEQMTYSLIFPIKDLKYGEIVKRNWIEGELSEIDRSALLLPWRCKSFLNIDFTQEEPGEEYFLSGHIKEALPDLNKCQGVCRKKEKYQVYSEYSLINKYLKDPRFEFVDNENEADILWYTSHFKQFDELSDTPEKFVNQFPFEYVLTVKDLLCIIARRKLNSNSKTFSTPPWLPVTYNLKTELPKFVSLFQHQEQDNVDNYWIIKPFNLARGLDTYITNNLMFILRLPITGPKIAQKYIENPILFHRPECAGKVKFDIRYVILLKSVKPLQIYIYKNFFLRFANSPFELRDFENYDKHFTVMNYRNNENLKHMLCSEFLVKWSQQYPHRDWAQVEKSILDMFKEVFECAVMKGAPCGIIESPQSRAVYAADIMLELRPDDEIQPKLLEINWMPDCERACVYYPNFYNDIFKLLFVDEENMESFHRL